MHFLAASALGAAAKALLTVPGAVLATTAAMNREMRMEVQVCLSDWIIWQGGPGELANSLEGASSIWRRRRL